MFPLSSLLQSANSFVGNRLNWVGTDLGRSALKMAEVERVGNSWQICQMQFIPILDANIWQHNSLSVSALKEQVKDALTMSPTWKRKKTAAIVSFSAADMRIIELPNSSEEQYEVMIEQELLADYQETREFDFWETPKELTSENSENISYTIYSVSQQVSNAIGKGLHRAGLDCQVLDGIPYTLARAIQLADSQASHQTSIALDWGYESATLTVFKSGVPYYTRLLKKCQIRSFLQLLQEDLKLSESDCWNLLKTYGVPSNASTDIQSALQRRLQPMVEQFSRVVLKEVNKTIQYIKQTAQLPAWDRLWLFGGGALLRQLHTRFGEELQTPVTPWSLPLAPQLISPEHEKLLPLFGPAAALSAIRSMG